MAENDADRVADALAGMSGGPNADDAGGIPSRLAHAPPPSPSSSPRAAGPATGRDDDDDITAAVAASRRSGGGAAAGRAPRRDAGADHALELKRTLIPILLTCGALLLAGAALLWLKIFPAIADWEMWIPMIMLGGGVVLLTVAVANMLQVREALRRRAASAPAARSRNV